MELLANSLFLKINFLIFPIVAISFLKTLSILDPIHYGKEILIEYMP